MQNITMLHIQKSDVTPSLLYTADTLCFILLTVLMVCEECQFQSVQFATVKVHSCLDNFIAIALLRS